MNPTSNLSHRQPPGPVLVMGAGSVGCYVGGCLQSAGVEIHFVGRPRVLSALRRGGMRLTDINGLDIHLMPAVLNLHDRIPDDLDPALVLLCVKSGATAEAAVELGRQLQAGTPVLSLQNGVGNGPLAEKQAPALQVCAGMVPYNIAQLDGGPYAHFHRGTAGVLAAQEAPALMPWREWFQRAGIPLNLHADLKSIQWGKLLLNLNNPVNALSGLPLREQLLDRDHRRQFADLMEEALALIRADGLEPAQLTPLRWDRLITVLRLPTPLFRIAAARLLRIDPEARSSMSDDVRLERITEIDALCGEIVRLAERLGKKAPHNDDVQRRIQALNLTRQTGARSSP